MGTRHEHAVPTAEREVHISRTFDAPRERVFQAWTHSIQFAQWWGPRGFTNPVCRLDAQPGGGIFIVMRGPDGTEYPMGGTFREIEKPVRLVFDSAAEDKEGTILIEASTVVTFEERGQKTEVTVHESAAGIAPVGARMLEGMELGLTQSLDRLADLLVRLS